MNMLEHESYGFMPHGGCYLWTKSLIALHATSDALIVLSYYSIPIALLYFVRKRKDLKFNWMFVCFAIFILACGTTHLLEIWNIWHADYWFSGGIKALTALASVPTAILLFRLIPVALTLPSPDALKKANEQLEVRVQERTAELTQTTQLLEKENRERQRAEIELKASLQEVRDLQTALDEHCITEITDPAGNICFVNDKFCSISQYSREELIGKNNRFIKSGFHSKDFFRELWEVINQGKVWHGEIMNRAKDGSIFWVETSIVPFFDDQGKIRQFVAVHSDITERNAAAEKIKRLNADLEVRVAQRTADLEAFSYSISHDLKAPVRTISGLTTIIMEEHGRELSVEVKGLLNRIWKSGVRMGQLIDALMSFSRLGREAFEKTLVSPTAIAQDVVEEIKLEWKGGEVVVKVGVMPEQQAEPLLLRQVFTNIISNAFKYSRNRTPAVIDIGAQQEDGRTVFYVSDNGAGFDSAKANDLFGVFKRFHSEAEFEGNGAGLAIAQRIIQLHGGKIWAESAPDKGAVFYFTLAEDSAKPRPDSFS